MVQELHGMKEGIWDIGNIEIEKELPVEEKLRDISDYMKDVSFEHINEGYVVRVHFGKENYSATDAVKHYLKQIAQLKY